MNKTLAVELQDLREQIAQDIESWEVQSDTTNLNPEVYKIIKQTFANVARGTND